MLFYELITNVLNSIKRMNVLFMSISNEPNYPMCFMNKHNCNYECHLLFYYIEMLFVIK
jgi:hypothetical protein